MENQYAILMNGIYDGADPARHIKRYKKSAEALGENENTGGAICRT